ncbi:SDR family oxidoreductase [Nakamurella deserti]|uniref:SDR family oxidoreductase n=1 Tax=Nakamurella deserti TaxID=2164074 RepID=UPI000DBE70C3|nr:SDR family oxidoreductase [Nakamurella deserti]
MTTARDLAHTTALVIGANRGLGAAVVRELLARGATVYAAARRPGRITVPGVTPVQLDITDPASVAAAAAAAPDVDLLINNAGTSGGADLLTGSLDDIRREMETHFFGTLQVTRAFRPSLVARRGAVVNVLSALSWFSMPGSGAYSAAKAAEWSMTNSLRLALAPDGVPVTALHVGYMDTDMTAGVDGPKSDPADVARALLDAVADGRSEVLFDDVSRRVQQGLAGGVDALYGHLTGV